jgi:amidohydrolase
VSDDPAAAYLEADNGANEAKLIALRRELHAHPELGRSEQRTTAVIGDLLAQAGLTPNYLAETGLWCDIGDAAAGPTVLLRADLDALPLEDPKDVAYRSRVPGVCHACGHDVHTAILLGVGLALGELAQRDGLPGRVRLVFQPAEEVMPGGAHDVVEAGLLEGVSVALALHCDPSLEVGFVGLRTGPITAASDMITVRLSGPGGHTSRPHNTVDLIFALGRLLTDLPAALNRRIDPRAAVTLVWGQVNSGTAPNAIPQTATARGTVRVLDRDTWAEVPEVLARLAAQIVAPYGAKVEIDHQRGVPPVVNSEAAVVLLSQAAEGALGSGAAVATAQSLGGEDFGWYLEHVPGAMARLGVRPPGAEPYDLHQPGFDVDERCIAAGVRLLTAAALLGLRS